MTASELVRDLEGELSKLERELAELGARHDDARRRAEAAGNAHAAALAAAEQADTHEKRLIELEHAHTGHEQARATAVAEHELARAAAATAAARVNGLKQRHLQSTREDEATRAQRKRAGQVFSVVVFALLWIGGTLIYYNVTSGVQILPQSTPPPPLAVVAGTPADAFQPSWQADFANPASSGLLLVPATSNYAMRYESKQAILDCHASNANCRWGITPPATQYLGVQATAEMRGTGNWRIYLRASPSETWMQNPTDAISAVVYPQAGQFELLLVRNDTATRLAVGESPAILRSGPNTLTLWVSAGQVHFAVNQRELASAIDSQATVGRGTGVGFSSDATLLLSAFAAR